MRLRPKANKGKVMQCALFTNSAQFWTLADWCEKCFASPPTLETKYFVGAGPGRYRPSIQKQALFGLEKDFVCPRLDTVGIKKKT